MTTQLDFSTSSTSMPGIAPVRAAVMPPAPEPRTTRSTSAGTFTIRSPPQRCQAELIRPFDRQHVHSRNYPGQGGSHAPGTRAEDDKVDFCGEVHHPITAPTMPRRAGWSFRPSSTSMLGIAPVRAAVMPPAPVSRGRQGRRLRGSSPSDHAGPIRIGSGRLSGIAPSIRAAALHGGDIAIYAQAADHPGRNTRDN